MMAHYQGGEEERMSKKQKDGSGGHLPATLMATGGIFVLRKVLAAVWTKVTGKEPPIDVTDPRVTWAEAVAWAVAMAIIGETARFGIMRAARRQAAVAESGGEPE
jgi:Protein of unknown function (DUF4235)